MHTPLFYLPYNIIILHSTVATYTGNADRTERALEEGKRASAGRELAFIAIFLKWSHLQFLLFPPLPNGIDPLSSASLLLLIVLDILNSMSYNSLIHPEISPLRWLTPIYFKFRGFIYLAISRSCDWVQSKPLSHLLL